MKRDIRDYLNQKGRADKPPVTQADAEEVMRQIDPNQFGQINNLFNQYSAKSDDELMSELLNAKQSGAMNPAALKNAAQSILPMLSQEQRQKLNEVLNKLGV